jgi:2-dehydro-3-deoxygalactonokinase
MEAKGEVLFCVDMGTTRTRVWVTEAEKRWARCEADFGVRNVALGQSKEWLVAQLDMLLRSTLHSALDNGLSREPVAIAAAGMITSEHGLYELKHLQAPVSISSLASNLTRTRFPGRLGIPLILVPGVRTASGDTSLATVLRTDLMRGEETLCAGLLQAGTLEPGSALLNLGSHWKWIVIDSLGQIQRSVTSLTGEMIHAVQTNTILSSGLPLGAPTALDPVWLQSGFDEASRSGLGRALFATRILELEAKSAPSELLSFVYGAFICDEVARLPSRIEDGIKKIVLSGSTALTSAWSTYLNERGRDTVALDESTREIRYIEGLGSLIRMNRTGSRHRCVDERAVR